MLQGTEAQVIGPFGSDQSAPRAFGGTKSTKKAPDSEKARLKEFGLELRPFTGK